MEGWETPKVSREPSYNRARKWFQAERRKASEDAENSMERRARKLAIPPNNHQYLYHFESAEHYTSRQLVSVTKYSASIHESDMFCQ